MDIYGNWKIVGFGLVFFFHYYISLGAIGEFGRCKKVNGKHFAMHRILNEFFTGHVHRRRIIIV
jgi:hypothetical protein